MENIAWHKTSFILLDCTNVKTWHWMLKHLCIHTHISLRCAWDENSHIRSQLVKLTFHVRNTLHTFSNSIFYLRVLNVFCCYWGTNCIKYQPDIHFLYWLLMQDMQRYFCQWKLGSGYFKISYLIVGCSQYKYHL